MRKLLLLFLFLISCLSASAADLYVGMKTCNITPDKPMFLAGQFYTRFGPVGKYPIQANILAIESRSGDKQEDSALVIGIDIASSRADFFLPLREAIKKEIPDFDLKKLIVGATHTHSSAVVYDYKWEMPKEVIKPSEWVAWSTVKIAKAAKEAWDSRCKAKFSYGLGHAVVGYNRRAVYSNGSAVMYGATNKSDFRAVEGFEDHDVNSMFFWNEKDKLIGMLVNVSCPSQEVEHSKEISSDYWGPTRENLKKKFGQDTVVVPLCGAAGDLSPHLRYMQKATIRMDHLRELNRLQEIGRRVSAAVEDTYQAVVNDKQDSPEVRNLFQFVELPQRVPTKEEYEHSKREVEKRKANPKDGQLGWNRRIIERFENLKKNPHPTLWTTVNVLRIGDAVLCTNQFELYTDFAIQIKARSKAVQTFVVQLSNGSGELLRKGKTHMDPDESAYGSSGTYLPSERAVQGGGYGAVIQSNVVGPEGGQVLVEKTLNMIDQAYSNSAAGQKALKKLDWHLAVAAYSYRKFTFFEAVDKIAALGVKEVEGFNFQKIDSKIPQTLDPAKLSDEILNQVNAKLRSAGVELTALYYGNFPADEKACRKIFENSKKLGIKYFVSEPDPKLIPMLDKLANEYKIIVGLHGHSKESSPNTWHPELVLKHCEKYSPMIGAFSDTGHWIRSELHPAEGVKILKNRLVGTEIHDCVPFDRTATDVPLGTGTGKMDLFFQNVKQYRQGPVLISIEYNTNPEEPSADIHKCIDFIWSTAEKLVK
ncbi:MAG: sugar phosphate isomerase/epimerase [Planctomycetia bacterium]|nr:sugar phosphate isomerase/epimerase [Planctomycetia bacterium]